MACFKRRGCLIPYMYSEALSTSAQLAAENL